MDAQTNIKARLPSRHVTEGPARAPHRSYYDAMGLTSQQIHQPFVGVASCWNEAAPCNISLMRQAQAVKKGVAAAQGTPREFCTITVTDGIAMGHAGMRASLPSREAIAEVFKKTPYIADLKPGGRYVAKDIFEVGGIPLLMKTLLDHGFLYGDCITVTGRTIAENLKSVKWNPNQDVVRPANDPITVTGGVVGLKGNLAPEGAIVKVAGETDFPSGYLWKYPQQVGPAVNGATHPGGKAEKISYADA